MSRESASLARFKSLLEVDPEGLEGVLARARQAKVEAVVDLAAADWERLIQIVKHGLDRVGDAGLQRFAIDVVAEVYEHDLGDAERALRWWAQVLAAYPHQERAAEELERLTRASGEWRRLVQVYAQVLPRLEPPARAALVLRLARVHLEELGEADRAERLLEGLWAEERSGAALEALQALYRRAGLKDKLGALLRQQIAGAATDPERLELWLQLGFLQEVELGAGELALESYREALKLDPQNRPATEALEQICLRLERWPELLMLYERLAGAARDPAEAAGYLTRMARICDDALGDRGRSRRLWQQVRELRGADAALLEEMARRFEPMERWEELREVIDLQVPLCEPAERVRLLERRARISGDRLGDLPRAIESWQRVLELEPESVVALLALCDLCGQAGAREQQMAALERLIALAERTGRETAFVAPLLASRARLEERELGRPERAIESWRRVLALEPGQDEALDALERLLAAELRWGECVEILERKLELARRPSEQTELLLRQAVILRDGVADREGAARAFRRVLELDAADEAAHHGLCEIHRERSDWQALTEQIFVWLESVTEARLAVSLLQEAAVIFEERMGKPDKAFLVWQAALRQDPGNEVTASNLERLAAALGRWEELLAVYQEVVQATSVARIRVGLLVAMGRCYGLELGELDRAVALLHQALHLDPESIAALDVLAECYRRTCRWQELLPVARRRAKLEPDPGRLVPLLFSLGELQCQLGAAEQALGTYRRVLELDPTHREALHALEALDLAFGLWDELARTLERQLALGVSPERRVGIHLRLAELHEQGGDLGGAIGAYHEVLALEPGQQEALHALERLYDQTGESQGYLEILERQLDFSEDAERAVGMLGRLAEVWEEQLGKPDRAMACLEKLLLLEPASRSAHAGLARLCREGGDLRRLAEVLRRHADIAEGSERLELLLELGGLLADTLRELAPADQVYEEALALAPGEPRVLRARSLVQEKLGAWGGAASTLEQLAAALAVPEERAAVRLRLGRIQQSELGAVAEAERRYREALEDAPRCFEAMQRLAEICLARSDFAAAAAMMVQAEPHTDLQARKAQLLYDAAMIKLERLGDEPGAAELLARTLQLDPDHAAAGLPLSRIYEAQGRLAELEPVLDMLIRKVDRGDRLQCRDLNYRLGCTARALGKNDKALRCFVEARSHDLVHLPTLRALAPLQLEAGEWQEAFRTLQTLLVHHREALSAEEVAETFFRLGAIKEQQGEQRKALGYLDKALDLVPAHPAALAATARLQSALGNWEAVARAKGRLAGAAPEPERPGLLEECAVIFLRKLGDVPRAVEAYHAAAMLCPEDRGLLNRFLDVLGETHRWQDALQVVLRLAGLEAAPQVRAQLVYAAAAICRDELDQPERALQLFEQALDAAPDHLKAFEAIDRLCTARKDWPTLAQAYRRMIARQGDDAPVALRATFWHNLGEVQRTRLGQIDLATASFEVASRLEPEHLERHVILAELYQLGGPAQAERAIAEHRILLAREPGRTASLSALAALYAAQGQPDAQRCLCGALTLLGSASAEERELYRRSAAARPPRAQGFITDELWALHVRHASQDPRVDELLAAAAPLLLPRLARPAKELGLRRKHRLRDGGTVYDLLCQAIGLLGVPADLYVLPEQQVPLMLANTTAGPAVVVGATLLDAPPAEAELAFTLGQQLTCLRPGVILSRLFPSPSQLGLALLAVLHLTAPELTLTAAEAVEVDRFLEQLAVRSVPAELLPRLAAAARPFAAGTRPDLAAWWHAVTHTANRVGLIVSGDLHAAARVLQGEPSPFGTTPASDRIRELVAYAVSEGHFEVRRALGLA